MTTSFARSVAQRLVAVVAFVGITAVGTLMPVEQAGAVRSPSLLEAEFFDQLNEERAARGLVPLIPDATLESASRQWATTMSGNGNLVHSDDGRAEIIAYGYRTGQITLAWMKSPGHRNLIVDPNLVYAGVGVTCDATGRMWAAVQYRRLDTRLATLHSSPSSPAVTPNAEGSDCGDESSRPSVQRLYQAFFLRESDASGLAFWVRTYQSGSSLSDIADQFASSQEFDLTYGSLSDREFVRQVYLNVMNRVPDEAGFAYWISQMSGGLTRGELMVGFSESAEFVVRSGIS